MCAFCLCFQICRSKNDYRLVLSFGSVLCYCHITSLLIFLVLSFFLVNLPRGLLILLIFSKNQLLTYVINFGKEKDFCFNSYYIFSLIHELFRCFYNFQTYKKGSLVILKIDLLIILWSENMVYLISVFQNL